MNWDTPEGRELAERMKYAFIFLHLWRVIYDGCEMEPGDAFDNDLNDAARQLGEKHGMHVEMWNGLYFVVVTHNRGETLVGGHPTHTAACMAMAELALKEDR